MSLVLDASMALAWLFERENAEEANYAERTLLAVAEVETWVPALWHTEVANALLVGERRGVVTKARVIDYLNRLSRLPIATDEVPPVSRRDMVMALAREHGLSAYDANYLDLALRTGSSLATFDRPLATAMRHAGGTLFSEVTS